MYVPITPGGTVIIDLASKTKKKAWKKLLKAVSHMPYKNKKDLKKRGYTIERFTKVE